MAVKTAVPNGSARPEPRTPGAGMPWLIRSDQTVPRGRSPGVTAPRPCKIIANASGRICRGVPPGGTGGAESLNRCGRCKGRACALAEPFDPDVLTAMAVAQPGLWPRGTVWSHCFNRPWVSKRLRPAVPQRQRPGARALSAVKMLESNGSARPEPGRYRAKSSDGTGSRPR